VEPASVDAHAIYVTAGIFAGSVVGLSLVLCVTCFVLAHRKHSLHWKKQRKHWMAAGAAAREKPPPPPPEYFNAKQAAIEIISATSPRGGAIGGGAQSAQ